MYKAFDCAVPIGPTIAGRAVRAGYHAAIRYYGTSSSGKLLTPVEAGVLCAAGLRIISVFERTADRALAGAPAGRADAIMAMQQAKACGQPEGTPIFFATDTDVAAELVAQYYAAIAANLDDYVPGVYGNGAICQAMLDAGYAERAWVWAGGKTLGTAAFVASNRWDIRQYPPVKSGDLGIEYDPDDVRDLDAVSWLIGEAAPVQQPVAPPVAVPVAIPMALDLQRTLQAAGFYGGELDGKWGPLSQRALADYYAR